MKKLVHLSQIEKKFHIYWTYANYWIFISIRPGQTGLCQSNPHSYMPLSLCDVSVLLHGIITSNTAEAFFLYFCCKAIRVQTEKSYDLIGPRQYQRRKRYGILNFKSHTTHSPSQSAPTILKNGAPCFLQKAGWKKQGHSLFKKRRDQAA